MQQSPLEMQLDRITTSESEALSKIIEFKNVDGERFDRLHDAIDFPFDKLTSIVEDTQVATTIGNLVQKALVAMNEALAETLSIESVLEEFREAGHSVESLEDVSELTIEESQDVLKGVPLKYQALAVGEGIATGAIGLPGALIDLPALLGLSLRATLEIASYYGFDPADPFERNFAVLILAIASASTDESKRELIEALEDITSARSTSTNKLPEELGHQVAQALVLRLVRGKVGQAVPVAGAVVGGGYNRSFLKDVCDTAETLYSERWLLARHGAPSANPS